MKTNTLSYKKPGGRTGAMLAHHCKRLFCSREFGITLLLSLLLSAYFGFQQLSELRGSYLETVSPNWWYCCFYYVRPPFIGTHMTAVLLAVPFIGSLVYGAFFYDDHIAKRDTLLILRGGRVRYWLSGGIAAFFGGFLICFVFEALWRLMLLAGIPADAPKDLIDPEHAGAELSFALFPRLLIRAPWRYALLYTLLPALYSGLLAVATLGSTLLFPKQKKVFHILFPGLTILALSLIGGVTVRLLKLPFHFPEVTSLMTLDAPRYPEYRLILPLFYIGLAALDAGMLFAGIRKNRDLL